MITCKNFDEILRRGSSEELAALETHAMTCAGCRVQLELDRAISAAAPSLHKEWDSPSLWPRIQEAIAAQSMSEAWWSFGRIRELFAVNWRPAMVTAAVAVLAVVGTWVAMRVPDKGVPQVIDRRLLTEQALRDTEAAEAAYVQSIERLASLAESRLARADSPLLISYREKLIVLDAAISELRQQSEANRFNAHLRTELSSLYHEKQKTLHLVLQEN